MTYAEEFFGANAVVTGGTKGFGAAIARRLADAGATVLVAARKAPQEELPAGISFVEADLSTEEGVRNLAWAVAERLGGVDFLINNAGRPDVCLEGAAGLTDAEWQSSFEINLLSAVRLDRALLPGMLERGRGVIIHMSSVSAHVPSSFLLSYGAMKAALASYSKGLAEEVAPYGVRVNRISPGSVRTPGIENDLPAMAEAMGTDLASARAEWEQDLVANPMGKEGDAQDIAELVAFLVSDRARWITGADHVIDGGMLRSV